MASSSVSASQRRVNVLVHHGLDEPAAGAVAVLQQMALVGAAEPFVVVVVDDENGYSSTVYGLGEPYSADLLDLLSQARELEILRVVGVLGSERVQELARRVNDELRAIHTRMVQTKGRDTKILDIRVQAITVDEQVAPAGIFSPASALNIALIPHDRASDLSHARLVRRDSSGRLEAHIATELATVLGLWTTVVSAPVDLIEQNKARGGMVTVHFARSLVRGLFCPPLPLDQVLAAGEALPMPPGFFATPDSAATVRAVARDSLPEAVRFVAGRPPEDRHEMSLPEAMRVVPGRLMAIVRSLPAVLLDGFGRDLESLKGDGLQEIIGRDAWLSIAFRDRQDGEPTNASGLTVANAIAELELRDTMPVLSGVPSTLWTEIIERVLGVADGSDRSSDARGNTGEARFLLADPRALCSPPQGAPVETVRSLLDELDPEPVEPTDLADPVVETLVNETAPEASPAAVPADGAVVARPAVEVPQAQPGSRPRLRETIGGGRSLAVPPGGLLGLITQQMVDETHNADAQLFRMLEELRLLVDESERADASRRVSRSVRFMLGGSIAAMIFVLCVCTGAAKVTDLHWMQFHWRVVLWVLMTAAVVVPAFSVLKSLGRSRWIRVAIGVALLGAGVLAAFHPAIRNTAFVSRFFGRAYWPLWPITLSTIVVGVLARISVGEVIGNWRAALGRMLSWITSLYALAVVIVAASSSKSVLQPSVEIPLPGVAGGPRHYSADFRQILLEATLFVGLLVFVAAIFSIAVDWVRIEYRNSTRGSRFEFAVGEARRSSQASRRTKLLTTQWLGTSSALARLIWSPLGAVEKHQGADQADLVYANDLLKFDIAQLELTPRGTEVLVAGLRKKLVRNGWLLHQYNRAAGDFLGSDPDLLGSDLRREEWPSPETCPISLPLTDILEGRISGRRWGFAEALYSGALDHSLSEVITENSAELVFGSVLRDPLAHCTVGAIDTEASFDAFFGSLLPAGPQNLPSGLAKAVFTAADTRRGMTTFVSWPSDLIKRRIDFANVEDSSPARFIEGSVFMATRCDISQAFPLAEVADIDWQSAESEVDNPPDSSPRKLLL